MHSTGLYLIFCSHLGYNTLHLGFGLGQLWFVVWDKLYFQGSPLRDVMQMCSWTMSTEVTCTNAMHCIPVWQKLPCLSHFFSHFALELKQILRNTTLCWILSKACHHTKNKTQALYHGLQDYVWSCPALNFSIPATTSLAQSTPATLAFSPILHMLNLFLSETSALTISHA